MKSKKGSYIVFLTMIFSAILIFILAALKVTGAKAIDNSLKDFGRLWGQSILAEYDNELKDRYGFFAFSGDEERVRNKLDYYGKFTYKEKKYIKFKVDDVDLADFRLTEQENFQRQIKEIVAFQIKPKYEKQNHDSKNKTGGITQDKDNNLKKDDTSGKGKENRVIRNKWIINGLPSKGSGEGVNTLSLIGEIKGGKTFEGLISKIAEDLYIFTFFKDYKNERNIGNTYFNNEIEYIISGKLDDEGARKSVYRKLFLLRNGVNLTYLYASEEKRNAALIAAEAITPGPQAFVTQALLLETWAFLEALNDIKILYDDKPVPLIKDDLSWALSIDNVVDYIAGDKESSGSISHGEKSEKKYVKPDTFKGIKYSDYLRIFITFTPNSTKLLRIMDLIQINMKYDYVDTFLLSEYRVGLKYTLTVNGNKHEFEEKY